MATEINLINISVQHRAIGPIRWYLHVHIPFNKQREIIHMKMGYTTYSTMYFCLCQHVSVHSHTHDEFNIKKINIHNV